jgi:hypothetical protein
MVVIQNGGVGGDETGREGRGGGEAQPGHGDDS